MKTQKIPQKLQGILWSVDVNDLDIHEDRNYIINQILSLGILDELKWLLNAYSLSTIKEVFIQKPAKIYTPSAFHFCRDILLGLEHKNLPANRYVRTLPRNIGS
jgi:hypothetical protein